MAPKNRPTSRVVRLKTGEVMCQIGTCTNEAEFLVRRGVKQAQAVCREHLKAMGMMPPEEEAPPK